MLTFNVYAEFQFQYGAIESFNFDVFSFEYAVFQFQYGAIERKAKSSLFAALNRISIPVWCDWKWLSNLGCWLLFDISIPVWCDWKYRQIGDFVHLRTFQFQYGAIESVKWVVSHQVNIIFQFQYGAIERFSS